MYMRNSKALSILFDVIDLQDNKASELDLAAEGIRAPLKTLSYLYILS
jgi:hypothetical protein